MHRRTGRPQANPLTCQLGHADTHAFKTMVKRRGITVNALLTALAKAELKTWSATEARPDGVSTSETNFHQLGHTPKREPPAGVLEPERLIEADAPIRRVDPARQPTFIESPGRGR